MECFSLVIIASNTPCTQRSKSSNNFVLATYTSVEPHRIGCLARARSSHRPQNPKIKRIKPSMRSHSSVCPVVVVHQRNEVACFTVVLTCGGVKKYSSAHQNERKSVDLFSSTLFSIWILKIAETVFSGQHRATEGATRPQRNPLESRAEFETNVEPTAACPSLVLACVISLTAVFVNLWQNQQKQTK